MIFFQKNLLFLINLILTGALIFGAPVFVKGEELKESRNKADEQSVFGVEKAEEDTTLLTVTVNGYGKRTELSEYLRTGPDGQKIAQGRGGKGLKNYNITPKTGKVAGCRVVKETDDVMIIENGGVIIRVPAAGINVYKRDVQGVIVMRVEEGNQIVSIERVAAEEENQD